MVWLLDYRLDALVWTVLALLFAAAVDTWLRYRRRGSGVPLLAWLLIVTLVAAAVGRAEYDGINRRDRLRQMVAGMAPTYAQELRRLGHAGVTLDTLPDDPRYLRLIQVEKEWLQVNPSVADIYTLRPDRGGVLRFIVDSETDYDGNGRIEGDREERTPIGEAYEDVNGMMQQALMGHNVFDDQPVEDRWGVWVSAYSPILDEQGRIEAIVGVDYPADKWVASIAEARRSALLTFSFFLVLVVLGGAAHQEARAEIERQRAHQTELQAAQWAAQAANETKSLFLANMSHELRTPLTAILGYGEHLREQLADLTDRPQLLDACDSIHRNGEHLLSLINDLLDLTKIEAGKLAVERLPVSPRMLLAEVESAMRLKAAIKGLKLQFTLAGPIPQTVQTDPMRVKQILLNLVGNAIKFTERGTVTVTLRLLDKDSTPWRSPHPALEFTVADTGIGMRPEELSRLFHPFTQADASTTRKFGGTGLGLTISRHLAQLLGGDVTVISAAGIGSEFKVTVDAGPLDGIAMTDGTDTIVAVSPAPAPTAGAKPLVGCRILMAEDGPDNQRIIAMLLTKAGAEVMIVENGQQCVEAALDAEDSSEPFDVVLSDIQMPVMDGYEATRKLRAAGYRRPIVALTANAMLGDREKCLAAGCDDYVPKPIQREKLYAVVERLVSAAKSRSQAAVLQP